MRRAPEEYAGAYERAALQHEHAHDDEEHVAKGVKVLVLGQLEWVRQDVDDEASQGEQEEGAALQEHGGRLDPQIGQQRCAMRETGQAAAAVALHR